MNIITDVIRRSSNWQVVKDVFIKKIVKLTLLEIKKIQDITNNIELSIMLVEDKESRSLNNKFRKKDYPTNVLSFPTKIIDFEFELALMSSSYYIYIGEVMLSYNIIKAESIKYDKKIIDHCTHLLIHGILHLIGYDHQTTKEAEEMENLEVRILDLLNIADPYN